jgi:hypothetical protein
MKNFRPSILLTVTIGMIAVSSPAQSQVNSSLMQVNNAAGVTWGLSGLGFYSIYKASKGA